MWNLEIVKLKERIKVKKFKKIINNIKLNN